MYKIKDPRKKAHFLVDHGPSLRTSSLVGLIKFAYANNLIKKKPARIVSLRVLISMVCSASGIYNFLGFKGITEKCDLNNVGSVGQSLQVNFKTFR